MRRGPTCSSSPSPRPADEAAEDALLDELAALAAPWVLLSAGAGYDVFASRLERALERGGAVGFIVGRVLWQDAVGAPDVDAALAAGARPRLERLLELLEQRGRHALPLPELAPDPAWFRA